MIKINQPRDIIKKTRRVKMSISIDILNNTTETFYIISPSSLEVYTKYGQISSLSNGKYSLPPGNNRILYNDTTINITLIDGAGLCLGEYSVSMQTTPNIKAIACSLRTNKIYSSGVDSSTLYICPIDSTICNNQCCNGDCVNPGSISNRRICCPKGTVGCNDTCCDGICMNNGSGVDVNICCPKGSFICNSNCCNAVCVDNGTNSGFDMCCPKGSVGCNGSCCNGACIDNGMDIGINICCPLGSLACNGSCCDGVCSPSGEFSLGTCIPKENKE